MMATQQQIPVFHGHSTNRLFFTKVNYDIGVKSVREEERERARKEEEGRGQHNRKEEERQEVKEIDVDLC